MLEMTELFEARKLIRNKESKFDKNLNDNERAIVDFIASRNGTRIKDIQDEEYFDHLSLSTIKRCVGNIRQQQLVKMIKTGDKRDRAMLIRKKVIA